MDVDDFNEEKQCFFKNEKYFVRDNGAIYRHPSDSKKPRKNDNLWTFGKESKSNPYLHHSGVRVHRIVATAFHGEQPNEYQNIVDHIDTNCKNNRPDNLRWVSRIENALNNPITRKRIEYLCGSIEAFLDDPSMLRELSIDRNISWMRTVTKEEADNSKQRMSIWTNQKKSSHTGLSKKSNTFNQRVYEPLQTWEVGFGREPGLYMSNTRWCVTYLWRENPYFPLCPEESDESHLSRYFRNIVPEATFSYSKPDEFSPEPITNEVIESKCYEENKKIFVLTKTNNKKWNVIGIELDRKTMHFVHLTVGSFDDSEEAKNKFSEVNGITKLWTIF